MLTVYRGDAQGEINNSEVWLELEFIQYLSIKPIHFQKSDKTKETTSSFLGNKLWEGKCMKN